MRIAIVGAGISGLTAAWLLDRAGHEAHLFEAAARPGGHTNTIEEEAGGRRWVLDTGFIVHNERNYPILVRLFRALGIPTRPSSMSWSVRCERTGLEYNGAGLNRLFCQRRNILRPSFHGMILDILRFHREAARFLAAAPRGTGEAAGPSIGEFVARGGYSDAFRDLYLLPMGAAIWSADPVAVSGFPARFFLEFFRNHGMLSVADRPQWRVVDGGARRYVEAMTAPLGGRLRAGDPVVAVRRGPGGVEIRARSGPAGEFDGVVLACHSDQALAVLSDPSPAEREILGAIPYQENEAVLHTDTSLLPRRRLAWASWNYHVPREPRGRVAVTYDLSILQGHRAPVEFLLTLNQDGPIAAEAIRRRIVYHHPVFTREAVAARARRAEISGRDRTWYCGAYWGWGFHEDGARSGLDVARAIAGESAVSF